MAEARVLGITGWSGSGKTVLITRLIPELRSRGLKIATVKHAHHGFETDQPGKDSYEHRNAGASEVIVSSARRWAQVHELDDEHEATLAQLLRRISPCELILVEGFKTQRHPKLEVYRAALGQPPLWGSLGAVVAVASDTPVAEAPVPVVDLNDIAAVADLVCARAQPLSQVLSALDGAT